MHSSYDAAGQEKADYIACVIRAHSQLRILSCGLAPNGSRLQWFNQCSYHRRPMPEADPAVEGPINDGKLMLARLKTVAAVELALTCYAERC